MYHKDGLHATCPAFCCRIDFEGLHIISCIVWKMAYYDKAERDADYKAACCEDWHKCPYYRVPISTLLPARGQNRRPVYFPLTSKYPHLTDLHKEEIQREDKLTRSSNHRKRGGSLLITCDEFNFIQAAGSRSPSCNREPDL